MAELLRAAGLDDVETDAEGNVLGWLPGAPAASPRARPLVMAAHLDTVFPAGTEIRVERDGETLRAPGIGDDGRGLAALLALARCCVDLGIRFAHPVLLAATVGEEGVGDLRGVRHLFSDAGAARDARGFVSIDGAGSRRIVTYGLGSLRYRIRATGVGGHSWVDFGTANPIHLVSSIVGAAAALPLPADVTLSVGRMAGGTSVNAIPEEAWAELEIRGRRAAPMEQVRVALGKVVDTTRERLDRDRTVGPPLELEVERIGNRPPGRTEPDTPLVRAAVSATRALGVEPEFALSSTDANLPMSLGIPAITIGGGGSAGQAHTLDEWYTNTKGPDGIARALLTLVLTDRALQPAQAAD